MSDPAPSVHTAAPGALRHMFDGRTEWRGHLMRHEIFARTDGFHGVGVDGLMVEEILRLHVHQAAIVRKLCNTTDSQRRFG
jgi:hypothetical protein